MEHQLEKIVCPQCGGNDLLPFGNSAYKCQACGTILKDEQPVVKVVEVNHYSAPVSDDFKEVLEHNESLFTNSEERYTTSAEEKMENMDGDSFLKFIVIAGVLVMVALIAVYFLS